MSKTCARCEKTVYPIEEFKCLDKTWHKGCFKCHGCGMTLNMKTYKGFDKQPYCEAHIPKAKATTMAETPELKRIAGNTKNQSNISYHADFEKSKGKFTQVADDPETLRIKQNSKIISNVAYHGDLAKKAAMEKQRTINENGEIVESPDNDPESEYLSNQLQGLQMTTSGSVHSASGGQHNRPPSADQLLSRQSYIVPLNDTYDAQGVPNPAQYKNAVYNNANYPQSPQPPYSNQQQQQHGYANSQNYPSQHQVQGNVNQQFVESQQYANNAVHQPRSQHAQYNHPNVQQYSAPNTQPIGKIADYDPVTDGPRDSPYTARQASTLIYSSDRGAVTGKTRRIGSIADMDPVNNVYGSLNEPYQDSAPRNSGSAAGGHGARHPHNVNANKRVFRAMYDYSAQDSDEVSFSDGDLIVNVTCIDEGWMTGTVQRTGQTGMLPANYVEVASI